MSLGKKDDVTLMPMFSHTHIWEVHPCILPKSLTAPPKPILLPVFHKAWFCPQAPSLASSLPAVWPRWGHPVTSV